jgi:superfamily II DNA or RNA helicase
MQITFPHVFAINEMRAKNPVQQMGIRAFRREGSLSTFSHNSIRGSIFHPSTGGEDVIIIPQKKALPSQHKRVIQSSASISSESVDLSIGLWIKHPILTGSDSSTDRAEKLRQIVASWEGAFSYIKEDPDRGITGLRGPQLGAIHSAHAHWATSDGPGTIVMPTGTGKTDTMLSIMVSMSCPKVFVVVPSDALRTQIVDKFLTLGILKSQGCTILHTETKFPIVCTLKHRPQSADEVDDIFGNSQVIVATSSIAGRLNAAVQERIAHHCPYLFIDEAHHAEAPTWKVFKEAFKEKRVLQFTATPFREDGKALDGKVIFSYPLKKAQEEGYFKPIRFQPVVEFNRNRSDRAIAEKAISQLREDWNKGHILMARVDSVARAQEVFSIYEQYPDLNPVQLHTGIHSPQEREATRQRIISGTARIIVCVDMLGEGFDLPELKIAAFHDIRKSLAVTLQLAGRFTRARPDLGNATFIANTAEILVQDELKKLYTRDPDWNILLPLISEQMVGEQQSLQDFLQGFSEFPKEIPLKFIRPATSTVVYRTTCSNWSPENYRKGISSLSSCEQIYETTNHEKHAQIIVTARRVQLNWSDIQSLYSWEWDLYITFWSPEQHLLFIHGSSKSGEYAALAHAIAGDTARLIKGQEVFRAFAGITRLCLQNVGLMEQLGRNNRYIGRMGPNIEPTLTSTHLQHTYKAVISGSGFEAGGKTTVGASKNGRIWAHRRERLDQLLVWCKKLGTKLLDTSINTDELLAGTLASTFVTERPAKIPIAIDWSEEVYTLPEDSWTFEVGSLDYPLHSLDLELVNPSLAGPLRFAIVSEAERVVFELEFFDEDGVPNYRFLSRDDRKITVRRGSRSEPKSLLEFFYDRPPIFWFSDGSSLNGNLYVELKGDAQPYDSTKITAWDWAGINLRKESQGRSKDSDSIQAHSIRQLLGRGFEVIFDDDGSGEAADIVAVKIVGGVDSPTRIKVEFYHCKYSQEATPGQRIGDLYEVCGQAQKSISWMSSHEKSSDLFTHLLRRESIRQGNGGPSRIEVGDEELLLAIREMSQVLPVGLKIFIVQPGLMKSNLSHPQLLLLSVTENHLMETYQLEFGVISSA